jgi:RNA polymerase II subunit A-like phosphatase
MFGGFLQGDCARGLIGLRDRVGIVEIEEPCTHEVQFAGLCAMCGKDMTE